MRLALLLLLVGCDDEPRLTDTDYTGCAMACKPAMVLSIEVNKCRCNVEAPTSPDAGMKRDAAATTPERP